jgi:hypothetical protein
MKTALSVPEIAIFPSDIITNVSGKSWYAWKMKVYEESIFDSYDHGDLFYTVEEALAHACSVFQNLVNHRHLFPSNIEQEFKVTITKQYASRALAAPDAGLLTTPEKVSLHLVPVVKNRSILPY